MSPNFQKEETDDSPNKKNLYATDLSDNSAYVLRHAINYAKRNDAKIIILHVLDIIPAIAKTDIVEEKQHQILKGKITYTLDRIQKRLKIFCEKELKDDPGCTERVEFIEVREGFPAEVILSKADELNCDVIIMGTHGRKGFDNIIFGSVAERVIKTSPIPVLVVNPYRLLNHSFFAD
jgi:nucleotide-binding universal stress UspA family protein